MVESFGSVEEKAKKIFGERASFYSTSTAHTDPQVLERVVEMSSPGPDWTALDVATGTGHTAFALAPSVSSVVGTDLTREMLAEAKRLRAFQAVSNVVFCAADVHHLPFAAGSFGLVSCRRAAHHFSGIGVALQEMHRVLRAGGKLVVDDRSVPEDDFVDQCMNTLDRLHDHSHVRQYRSSEWVKMLEAHGFVVDRIESYIKHRPLASLTDGIPSEDTAQIHQILGNLNDTQRAALNLVEVGGEHYINHWFVMISAKKG
ncbi:MAG: methyltransferase domain-containing protein [Deltaproteobacteria bacterium]|nr:methyltransferase domain-containing protein [Deltaproteobacteria bacterium]